MTLTDISHINFHIDSTSNTLDKSYTQYMLNYLANNYPETTNNIYKQFLNLDIPLIGYIKNNQFYIDLKAIPDDQINLLIQSIKLISK